MVNYLGVSIVYILFCTLLCFSLYLEITLYQVVVFFSLFVRFLELGLVCAGLLK